MYRRSTTSRAERPIRTPTENENIASSLGFGESRLARSWNEVVPFFAYPLQIRKMIYTTNAIESLQSRLA
jgi:transposase-like protein